ncbi:MAG: sigma-70 family RNA polymerase sigma factor [Actinomycetia bacterium]|nr:sigma-70 family RNA polymerase sigma factor [Actinomycetes bacterium]
MSPIFTQRPGQPDSTTSRIGLAGSAMGSVEQLVEMRLSPEELYVQYSKALVGFAATIVGPSDAEDIVASVAARVLHSSALRAADNQRAYLYRSVLNASRSHLRSQGRRRRREQRFAQQNAPPEVWSRQEPDLTFALDALSPRQRAVVHLTYWEELAGHEVAVRLGISEGSVRKHLARAKGTLRELIQ